VARGRGVGKVQGSFKEDFDMGWLPMYLNKTDVDELLEFLNDEDQIAYLVCTEPYCWKAVKTVDKLQNGETVLWHIPSGPLPLHTKAAATLNNNYKSWILDPFRGWANKDCVSDGVEPYFGGCWPGVISLNIKLGAEAEISMSCFTWIGNYFAMIGKPADRKTERYWQRLRRQIKKRSVPLSRSDDLVNSDNIYTFKGALEEIKNGKKRALNPI
jgi:hypothetical protein